jgi:hypothetical protein
VKILTRDFYIPDAAPGTYEHAGRHCWLCGRDQVFYRGYKKNEPLACTTCEALEGFGSDDLPETLRGVLEMLRAEVESQAPAKRAVHARRIYGLALVYLGLVERSELVVEGERAVKIEADHGT